MNPWTEKTESVEEWLGTAAESTGFNGECDVLAYAAGTCCTSVRLPEHVHPKLAHALRAARHHRAIYASSGFLRAVAKGHHVVTVTPTASGKTLCYNLPVLQTLLQDDSARALYLFPTKALAQDQVAELQELANLMEADIKTHTYDGDTPPTVRQAIRNAGHIVVTNPDMLHSAILPHHTKWVKLFENIKYIIIDELHAYRGVFGSHVANVIRRLKRICRFYGSQPAISVCIGNDP